MILFEFGSHLKAIILSKLLLKPLLRQTYHSILNAGHVCKGCPRYVFVHYYLKEEVTAWNSQMKISLGFYGIAQSWIFKAGFKNT